MTLFTEEDATKPTNPLELPVIPKDHTKDAGGDDIIFISTGAGQRWGVIGAGGIDTLRVDYSKVKTSHGLRFEGGTYSGNLALSENTRDKSAPYINYAGIEKLELTGTSLDDQFPTTSSDDVIIGGAGNDTIGGAGKDFLQQELGRNRFDGGKGTDSLTADFSSETAAQNISNTGISTLSNGTTITGIERFHVKTGEGDDIITLTGKYDDQIDTGYGTDKINPGLGKDIVYFGPDRTGSERDLLIVDYSTAKYGIRNNSTYSGVPNNNYYGGPNGYLYTSPTGLVTDAENSVHYTGVEQFNLTGTSHDDYLLGGRYSDIFRGGAGDDLFTKVTSSTAEADKIYGDAGKDTLELRNTDHTAVRIRATTLGNGRLNDETTFRSIEVLDAYTGNGNDNIFWRGKGNDVIKTNGGIDTIVSGGGNDFIDGGTGNDTLTGVNPRASNPGINEIDYIIANGTDSINLGDKNKAYYDGDTYQWSGDELLGDNIIARMMPNARSTDIDKYCGALYEAMKAFDITTPARIRAFLAQIAHESGSLRRTVEDLVYTTEVGLSRTFGRLFTKDQGQLKDLKTPPELATSYLSQLDNQKNVIVDNQEELANYVYNDTYRLKAGYSGLGNTAEGDGYNYRGRGLIQTTGKENFSNTVNGFMNVLGRKDKVDPSKPDPLVDFVTKPDLLRTDPEYAALSAAYFWSRNGLNARADQLANATNEANERAIFNQITRVINSGMKGTDERWAFYKTAKTVVSSDLGTYINDQEHALINGLTSSTKLFLEGNREDYFLIKNLQYKEDTKDYDLVVEQYKTFASFPKSVGIVYDGNNNRTLDQGDDLIALTLNSNLSTVELTLNFLG